MNKSYNVHRVTRNPVTIKAVPTGAKEPIDVVAAGIEVELVAGDGHSGSVTLRFIGSDAEAAAALFKQDQTVDADFLPHSEPKEA